KRRIFFGCVNAIDPSVPRRFAGMVRKRSGIDICATINHLIEFRVIWVLRKAVVATFHGGIQESIAEAIRRNSYALSAELLFQEVQKVVKTVLALLVSYFVFSVFIQLWQPCPDDRRGPVVHNYRHLEPLGQSGRSLDRRFEIRAAAMHVYKD